MKYKLYATKYADHDGTADAVAIAKAYLSPLPVEFSPIETLKEKETKKSLYDIAKSWALSVLKSTKSIKTNYLMDLPHEGYDGVILFLDKAKALESESLYGQHDYRNGKSYMEVYVNGKYIHKKINKTTGKYSESYTSKEDGAIRPAAAHGLIHEVFHALSYALEAPDILHTFIEEGQFEDYKTYLLAHVKDTTVEPSGYLLYKIALACLDTDVTPQDKVADVVACAETVNALHAKAFHGEPIGGLASTYNMYRALLVHPGFIRVDTPIAGDIVISPTGYSRLGAKTPIKNGHVGIVGANGIIMSNDSATGLLKANYNLKSWASRYGTMGGYPVAFFRKR